MKYNDIISPEFIDITMLISNTPLTVNDYI